MPVGVFIRIALNLQINLGRSDTLAIISLLSQEHGISLPIFRSSLISLISVFYFSVYRSCTYLVKIYLCFIFFGGIIKGILWIDLILISSCLLLVYRNTINFCFLTFHPENPSKLTYQLPLLKISQDFMGRQSCHLQINICMSYLFVYLFIYLFSYFIALFRTSRIIGADILSLS